jgi:tetrahydromethanopterin S-methyltransferase subunit B
MGARIQLKNSRRVEPVIEMDLDPLTIQIEEVKNRIRSFERSMGPFILTL